MLISACVTASAGAGPLTAHEPVVTDGSRTLRLSANLDLLQLPLLPDEGITRAGDEFIADRTWALVRFGEHRLEGGWWAFECRGEGDLSGVDVRLSSAADPLIVLPAQDEARLFLRGGESYHVTLLVSPWPVRRRFSLLRLRRVQPAEELAILAGGVRRLLTRDRPLQRAASVAKRLLARQSLGVRLSVHQATLEAAPASISESATPVEHKIVQGKGCFAVIAAGDRIHPRAFEIVEREFARSAAVQAIYADCREGGAIAPKPQWDEELAHFAPFAGSPTFFRGEGTRGTEPWTRLVEIVGLSGPAAICRIALPLAERDVAASRRIDRPLVPTLSHAPLVSVVIPTKYQVALLEKCLAGLAGVTAYPELEVVIVDNDCRDPRFLPMLEVAARSLKIARVEDRGGFNFPRLIDAGVKRSSGGIILLLNDDIEPVEPGWLHRMVDSVLRPGVGAVGARLNYPTGDVQHAGVMLGLGGVCGHLWKGTPRDRAACNPHITLPSRRMAVTGACLAVRRELYDAAGGLDQTAFPVAFNDIDFCLRLNALGHRTIYRGDAVLIHHESQTRGPDAASIKTRKRLAGETRTFLERWRNATADDPFGSPAFDRRSESGAVHSDLLRPWPAG